MLAIQTIACGVFLIAGLILGRVLPPGNGWVSLVFFISIVIGGWDAARDASAAIRKGRVDIHFLMITVAIGAAVIGAWHEGALLLFLFSLGGALEHFALHRMNREISALSRSAPKEARVMLESGEVELRPVDLLEKEDLLQVRPDEMFPVDSILVEGETEVDESSLTAEAIPVMKKPGDEVSSGTLNLWG